MDESSNEPSLPTPAAKGWAMGWRRVLLSSRERISKLRFNVTATILAIHTVVYFLERLFPQDATYPERNVFALWTVNASAWTLSGELWRPFTSIFIHGSPEHLITNSVGLILLGVVAENLAPWGCVLIAYMAAGIVASVAFTLYEPDATGFGSSGANEGLIGFIAGYYVISAIAFGKLPPKAFFLLVAMSILDFGSPHLQGTTFCHAVGCLSGLAYGLYLGEPILTSRLAKITSRNFVTGAAVLLLSLSILGVGIVPTNYFHRAQDAIERQEFDRAVQLFTRGLNLLPRSTLAHYGRARASCELGKYDAAVLDCDYVLAECLRRENPWNRMVDLNGFSEQTTGLCTYAKALRAIALFRGERYEEALNDLPTEPAQFILQHNLLEMRAYARMRMKRYREALDDYNILIAKNAPGSEYFEDRGYVKAGLRQFDSAIEDYSRAIELTPDEPEMRIARGYVSLGANRYQEALADANSVREVDPKSFSAHELAASVYFDQGLLASAETEWRLTLELAENEQEASDVKANLSLIRLMTARYEDALELAKEARAKDPKAGWAALMEAIALDQLGRKEEAREAHRVWLDKMAKDFDERKAREEVPERFWKYIERIP